MSAANVNPGWVARRVRRRGGDNVDLVGRAATRSTLTTLSAANVHLARVAGTREIDVISASGTYWRRERQPRLGRKAGSAGAAVTTSISSGGRRRDRR
ncbi:MAG TPA: hypothetical protein VH276_14970 [Solirubrobacteraceae bacterium]|nr:hypothetical protein [Solirubrobacteraceae bacterium]